MLLRALLRVALWSGSRCKPSPGPPGCSSPIADMIPRFGFRDPTTPYLAKCGGQDPSRMCWHVVVGSGTTVGRSAAGLLYRSQSAEDVSSQWSFVSALIEENASAHSEQYQYSCPDFFQLDAETWAWLSLSASWDLGGASHANKYFLGSLSTDGHRFLPSMRTPLTPPEGTPYRSFGCGHQTTLQHTTPN